MKLTHYLYMGTALALFAACSEEEAVTPVYTVGETDKAIELMAGISQSGFSGVNTRAGVEDHHDKHVIMTESTVMRLQVIGDWWKSAEATSGEQVVNVSLGTAGDVVDGYNTHRHLSLSPALNWDDYGTADPNNKGTDTNPRGRLKGLSIYGVTVDGVTSADNLPTAIKDLSSSDAWATIAWSVPVNQSSGWSANDLLISNNVKEGGEDGTYKFDEKGAGKLLEFKHAMSKITVNLTPGEGFTGGKFVNNPTVTLLDFYIQGKVNITTGATTEQVSQDKINTRTVVGGASSTTIVSGTTTATAQFDAIVFPGNTFTATIADDTKNTPTSPDEILKLDADGNVYYVTAAQLVKAMNAAGTTGTVSGTMEPGKNYVLNITVNKTKIVVDATIKDWITINSETALPLINVDTSYGDNTQTAFDHSFDFFRSLTIPAGYDEDVELDGINPAASYTYADGAGSWDKVLYWPDHNTHYFFRGVSPLIGTEATANSDSSLPTEAVTVVDGNDVIAVENVRYVVDTYPSDLAIALPRTTGTTCQHSGMTEDANGICATTGTVTMNFEYAMSKVEVRLKSTGTSDAGNLVSMTNDNVKVEIIDGYKSGRIKLSDGLHDDWKETDKGDYLLSELETPVTENDVTYAVTTRDAVLPQVLGGNVKFRITVTFDTDHVDVYEVQVNTIPEKDKTSAVTEWKHGEYYIYELDVKKTQINVNATITDWKTVKAESSIWF